jgi:phosphonate transport system substrate-binding protein
MLTLGAVAYDPKVVTIWNGFRAWFRERGIEFDYVLYPHYERQVEDLMAGVVDLAWHSPLAWVRTCLLARAAGVEVEAQAMRDTDRDLTSVVAVRADSRLGDPASWPAGTVVGCGAVDSPQATLLPLQHLVERGMDPEAVRVRRFDVGVGLHGDHVGGEREAAAALLAGEVDAACLIDSNLLLFGKEGTLPPGAVRVLERTAAFDHCVLAAGPGADRAVVRRFVDLLLTMSYADDTARPLLELEGLTEWLPGRTDGYAALAKAVRRTGFYDGEGTVVGYRP